MKNEQIAIGYDYLKSHGPRKIVVRIHRRSKWGGWIATNRLTGRRMHLASARRIISFATTIREWYDFDWNKFVHSLERRQWEKNIESLFLMY